MPKIAPIIMPVKRVVRAKPSANGTTLVAPLNHLTSAHLADLRKSGLSDPTIAAACLHTESDPQRIAVALHWKGPAANLGLCLAFPFFNAAGKQIAYTRFKPDQPRSSNGTPTVEPKKVKYESPRGMGGHVYFRTLQILRAALAHPQAPIIITEGEKKALKGSQEGFATVGLVGVAGWSKKREKDKGGKPIGARELLADLDAVSWAVRPVFIAFDSDAATKIGVKLEERVLAAALQKRGAVVKVVRLPISNAGDKVGLDDFLVAQGSGELRKLLVNAPAFEPSPNGTAVRTALPGELALTRLDTIRPQPVRWLVPEIIPQGKLIMFAGDGGQGKSALTLDLSACLTTGRPAFGLNYAAPEPCQVLLIS